MLRERVFQSLRSVSRLALLLAASAFGQTAPPSAACPVEPIPTVTSSHVPNDVCIPNGFTDLATVYFDDYSWRSFIAVVWPAAQSIRGADDAAKTAGDAGPRVFETWKSLWEVFHEDGTAPTTSFSVYDPPDQNACRAETHWGDVVLAASKAIDDIGQADAGELAGPLVAQNGRYVRYQTLYNPIAYDHIVRNKLYLRANLPEVPSPRPALPMLQFPNGSIAIKAAWLDMEGFAPEQKSRYYTRMAMVRNPDTGTCSRLSVGLVGLHVVQKTLSRPQWIWSSFEHVDNVPPARPDAPGKFAFNDGSGAPMPAENPLSLVPLAKQPAKPFNVVRSPDEPINVRTALTNLYYERLLKGTIWKNYQLVLTQWPRVEGNQATPVSAAINGDASHTFPGIGSIPSAFANVSMETFDQNRVEVGCMNCHNRARMTADFMWSVVDHAYPAKIGPAASAVRPANPLH